MCWALKEHNCLSGSLCAVPLPRRGLRLLQTPIKMSGCCVWGNKSRRYFPAHSIKVSSGAVQGGARGGAGGDFRSVLGTRAPRATPARHCCWQPLPTSTDCCGCPGLIHLGIWDVTTSLPWWVAHHCGLRVDASSSCSHLRFCVPSPSLSAGRGHDHKILPWPDSGQREKNRWKT